jgi:signal transduction histidine kinase
MAHPGTARRGGFSIAAGSALLVLSGLLVLRAAGLWLGDAIVWPTVVAAAGGLLIWRQPRTADLRWPRRPWAAHRPAEPWVPPQAPSALRHLPRPELSRTGLGTALVLAAGLAFLWANGATRPAGEVVLAGLVVLVALGLIFAPSWQRLAASFAAERAARIRAQERADLGAHLHDSVLQTLGLIQRSADQPEQVATLARRQERELRSWLAGDAPGSPGDLLGTALDAAAAEVEEATGSTIEVVVVGDCPLDEPAQAAVAAAREAMLNAGKFAGDAPIAVYAEVSPARIEIFVRDRGPGFDPAAIPPERRGVRESILGRVQRAGGRAVVRSAPGEGAEVEISIGRPGLA